MKPGICCIVLGLEDLDPPAKFQKMTFSSFSKKNREEGLDILGSRILNNIRTTFEAIKFCGDRGYCYRLSSDLFPLITYEKASISLEEIPQYKLVTNLFSDIRKHLETNPIRVSCHPSEFNVLATENENALARTARELNFYSWFMDQIGCPADHRSPINIHINNNRGSSKEISSRFKNGMGLLDANCRGRIVVENDDKQACWSVRKLIDEFHPETGCPITFDYLHHKCHPDGLNEERAIKLCYDTWNGEKPLFHYSESRDEKNPRAHADYPNEKPETYGLDFDLDFEFKMKDKAIELYEAALV